MAEDLEGLKEPYTPLIQRRCESSQTGWPRVFNHLRRTWPAVQFDGKGMSVLVEAGVQRLYRRELRPRDACRRPHHRSVFQLTKVLANKARAT